MRHLAIKGGRVLGVHTCRPPRHCFAIVAMVVMAALLPSCKTASQLSSADVDLLVVHAETTLAVAETSFDAFSSVAASSGMPAAEVTMRKARFENRIALLRSHLEWLKGKVVERDREN